MSRICLLVLAVFLSLAACTAAGIPSGTRITPMHFQFQTVIPPDDDPKGSGWRAVCIHAAMSQGMPEGLL